MPYNAFPSYNYSGYPSNSYQQISQAAQYPQYSGNQQPTPPAPGIVWVDGEVGAKAYQLPAGLPANAPMPLWDTNDTIIYLKSVNQMGMPNPIQKIRYTMEDQPKQPAAMSGQAMLPAADHAAQYVKKEDLDRMKDELKDELKAAIISITDKGVKNNAKSSL